MTEPPKQEWNDWQAAWHTLRAGDPDPAGGDPARFTPNIVELAQRLARHRRYARSHVVFDVAVALAAIAMGIVVVGRHPTPRTIAWAIGVWVFAVTLTSFSVWNRRDALFYSAQPTTDFVAALRLRLGRRAAVPRIVAWLVAAEIAFGIAYCAIWDPAGLPTLATTYAGMVLALVVWARWYGARVRRERAQLDALCEVESSMPA